MWKVESPVLLLPAEFDVLEGVDELTLRCRVCEAETHLNARHASRAYLESWAVAHRVTCKVPDARSA